MVPVAEYLYHENTFTSDQLEEIKTTGSNTKERMFTILEPMVARDSHNLLVFARSFLQNTAVAEIWSIGNSLLQAYGGLINVHGTELMIMAACTLDCLGKIVRPSVNNPSATTGKLASIFSLII